MTDAADPVRVTVAVRGRFHAFQLARELARRGALHRLYTSLPRFVAARHGVPKRSTRSLVPFEVAIRAWHRLPPSLRHPAAAPTWVRSGFDRAVSWRIHGEENVFVGWSSASLECLRRARSLGVATVLERGSTHIGVQTRLLREEYERYGLTAELPHPATIERELREYELAERIAVPSSFVRRTFVEAGVPEERLVVNPYGVDLEHFRPEPRDDGVFRVIHVGALSVRKGVHHLLRAFHELSLPGSELWLVGGYRSEIAPFLERYGSSRVSLRGSFPERELASQYARASVLCLASIEEGMAMVLLQAMACGLPVVCSSHTGGEDLVREGVDGFVARSGDVEHLKERIAFLYENAEARHEMGRRARERVSRGFSWSDYGDRALAIYRGMRACR